MKHSKVWGETTEIFTGQNVELHRIFANKGGYCSKHYHEHKYNLFFVESGLLQIETWREGGIVEKTVLGPSERTLVEPKLPHRFTALKDTIAFELYTNVISRDDIVRACQGGINGTVS